MLSRRQNNVQYGPLAGLLCFLKHMVIKLKVIIVEMQ